MEEKEINLKGCRAFISAILDQAFSDAVSRHNTKDKRTALSFIDHRKKMFMYYCELLDMEPEYVARKMQEKIRNHRFKSLDKFRE